MIGVQSSGPPSMEKRISVAAAVFLSCPTAFYMVYMVDIPGLLTRPVRDLCVQTSLAQIDLLECMNRKSRKGIQHKSCLMRRPITIMMQRNAIYHGSELGQHFMNSYR
jgi:hypothetical protein